MMNWIWRNAVVMCCVLVLSACAPAGESPTQPSTQTSTSVPTPTTEPTLTHSVEPTETEPTVEPEVLRMVSMYGGRNHQNWNQSVMIGRFEETHAGTEIDAWTIATYSSPVVSNQLERRIITDDPPDVITGPIGGGLHQNYIEQGLIMDITDLWEEQGWYDVYPQPIIDMASYKGRQYFLPDAVQWNPVFYRTDIFERMDLQPPETWEELLTLCETLQANDIVPFTMGVSDWNAPVARHFTMLNLRLNGLEFHQALMRGEVSFDDPRVRDVFEHWQEMFEHGCFEDDAGSMSYGLATNRLSEGRAAMYLLGEWLYESTDESVEQNLDFFSFPTLREDVQNAEIALVYGSFIHANSPNPELARDFLRYMGSEEVQNSIVQDLGRMSASQLVDSDSLPAYQAAGRDWIAASGGLAQLYEFNVFSAGMARGSLFHFEAFVENWQEEGEIELRLGAIESRRQEEITEGEE